MANSGNYTRWVRFAEEEFAVSIPARYPTIEEAEAVQNAATVLRLHARVLLGLETR